MAGEEPVGSDALIIQMAIVAKSMSGGSFKDTLVLSTSSQQDEDKMKNILTQFVKQEIE